MDEKTDDSVSNLICISSAKSFPKAVGDSRGRKDTIDKLDLRDILSARLTQMHGVLLAIRNTYDDEEGQYLLPPEHMENALWALNELLDQAEDARSTLGRDTGV